MPSPAALSRILVALRFVCPHQLVCILVALSSTVSYDFSAGKPGDVSDSVVAPANSIHNDVIDCMDAEGALLPAVPDESRSPSPCDLAEANDRALDMQSDDLNTNTIMTSSLICPFLSSLPINTATTPDISDEQHLACAASNEAESDCEMATAEDQMEEWDAEVFDP